MERLDVGMDNPYSEMEMALHLSRYLPIKPLCRRARVLDIASGAGYAAHIMRNHWDASRVFAVDISEEAIEMAKAQYDAPGLKYIRADAVRYLHTTRARFNLVVSVETIEHVPDPEEFLHGIKRVCEPGAAVYISAPNDVGYYGPGPSLNPYHRHVFTYDEFVALGTKVFGPPTQVMLGTLASGFAAVEAQASPPRSWREAIDATAVSTESAEVPSSGGRPVTPDSSVFYAALWGGEATGARLASSVAYFGNERTYRMPNIGLAGTGLATRPGSSAVVLVPREDASLPLLRQATSTLEGKVALELVPYTPRNVRRVLDEVMTARPMHVDLWGEDAVRAYFEHVPPSKQSVPEGEARAESSRTDHTAVSCVLPGRPADHGAIAGWLAFADDVIYVNPTTEIGREERLQFAKTVLYHLDRAREAADRGGARRRFTLLRAQSRSALLEERLADISRDLARISTAVDRFAGVEKAQVGLQRRR